STSGKLSALDCHLDDDEIEVVAIERHFGVARLLSFELEPGSDETVVAPESVIDLAPFFERIPNMEGISAAREGIFIVTDRGDGGVTERLVVGPFDEDCRDPAPKSVSVLRSPY
ncbi:MAG: hypothetical protein ACOC1F_05530, partial [Myxococcota bacterium]